MWFLFRVDRTFNSMVLADFHDIMISRLRPAHWTKNSENFSEMGINGKERFPENPELLKFWKGNHTTENHSRNSRRKSKWNGKSRKSRYTSQDCPLFYKFMNRLFHSSLKISENSNRNFSSNVKLPQFRNQISSTDKEFRLKLQVPRSSSIPIFPNSLLWQYL